MVWCVVMGDGDCGGGDRDGVLCGVGCDGVVCGVGFLNVLGGLWKGEVCGYRE